MNYKEIINRREANNEIKSGTAKNYKNVIGRCLEFLNCDVVHFFENIDTCCKKLIKEFGLKVTERNLISFSAIVKNSPLSEDVKNNFVKMRKKLESKLTSTLNDKSEKQKEINITWEECNAKIDEYPYDSIEKLIVAMYVLIPVRRQMEFSRIYTRGSQDVPKESTGYIDLLSEKPKIVFTSFKNSDKKGDETVFIENKFLLNLIFNSIITKQRDYLFVDSDNKPFKSVAAFTTYNNRMLKKIFKNEKMSVNQLRNIYANEDQNFNKIISKSKDLSHTAGTHVRHYMKNQVIPPKITKNTLENSMY